MSRHLNSQLLARLEPSALEAMRPYLALVNIEQGFVLAETHASIKKVYFPHAGIISCVVELIGGGAIEAGMIGRDGQFGGGAALDQKISLNFVIMQVAGSASVIDADRFRELAFRIPALHQIVMAYEQFFLAHVQQTAACNAVHTVEARTCKWLLRMQKLCGDDIPLTQEFLAQMMGVRRTSVTHVAVGLQKRGMITYYRGRITITDLDQIRETACECDTAHNEHYQRLFG